MAKDDDPVPRGHLPFCRVFVDDIMIFSADEPGEGGVPGKDAHQVHLDHLRQVLEGKRVEKTRSQKVQNEVV